MLWMHPLPPNKCGIVNQQLFDDIASQHVATVNIELQLKYCPGEPVFIPDDYLGITKYMRKTVVALFNQNGWNVQRRFWGGGYYFWNQDDISIKHSIDLIPYGPPHGTPAIKPVLQDRPIPPSTPAPPPKKSPHWSCR